MIYTEEVINNSLIGVLGTPTQLRQTIFEVGAYYDENHSNITPDGVVSILSKSLGIDELSLIYLLCAYSYFKKIDLPDEWINNKITQNSNVLIPAFYVAYISAVK